MLSSQIDLPQLEGFTTFYGIQVSPIAEDGALIVLGHHDDRRRVIAALNRHAREVCGLINLADERGASYDDAEGGLHRHWAVLVEECDDPDRHGDAAAEGYECSRCAEIEQGPWWINWAAKETDPGAFPVMVWEV